MLALVILGIVTIVVISVVLLQRFEGGTEPRQVSDGIPASENVEHRIRCSRCGYEMVPLTECPFCASRK
jgi:hypothetical protein